MTPTVFFDYEDQSCGRRSMHCLVVNCLEHHCDPSGHQIAALDASRSRRDDDRGRPQHSGDSDHHECEFHGDTRADVGVRTMDLRGIGQQEGSVRSGGSAFSLFGVNNAQARRQSLPNNVVDQVSIVRSRWHAAMHQVRYAVAPFGHLPRRGHD